MPALGSSSSAQGVRGEHDAGLRAQLERLGTRDVGGWKVGLTSGQARDSMGAGFRPFGYILRERIHSSGATLRLDDFGDAPRVGVENEVCFRLRSSLGGAASPADVMAAIDCAMPAFEINERRLGAGANATERLADNLNQWGIVVGEGKRLDWRRFDFGALEVALAKDGAAVETVAADGHIDDHFVSIAALARQLHRFGRALSAGMVVITGSYTRQSVVGASRWEGDFGPALGKVAVEFA